MAHTIRTETVIDASPDDVWAVLADFAAYPAWNPFIVAIEGQTAVGAELAVTLRLDEKEMQFRPHVVDWEPGRTLRWLGKAYGRWIFSGEHALTVEALDGSGTRFIHEEAFRGVAVPFLRGMLRRTEAGFRAMNAALKAQVEAITVADR